MDLKLVSAIGVFCQTVQNSRRSIIGTFEERQEPVPVETTGFALSEELEYLYSHYDSDLVIPIRNISLPKFESLSNTQYGYALVSDDKGNTWKPDPGWPEGWTVFSMMNDDPVAADTSIKGTPVLAAIEAIDYYMISPSLTVFFQLLTELVRSSEKHKANEPDSDKHFEEWIAYREHVVMPHFFQQAGRILDEDCLVNLKRFLC